MGIWHSIDISDQKDAPQSHNKSTPLATSESIVVNKNGGKLGLLSSPKSAVCLYPKLSSQSISVAVDGSVFNTYELGNALHLDNSAPLGKIIILLYQKYGFEGIYRLQGSFSLILHDSQKHLSVLYRSFLNGYPLYYVAENKLLNVSTNPLDLLRRTDVSDRLDALQMSSIFALEFKKWNNTVFSDLKEVQHGEMVTISSKGVTSRRRSLNEVLMPQKYASELDMIEGYRTLLDTTVKKHILPDKQYGIMLSSGMDSATLALFASRQLRQQGSQLHAYSWSLPNYQSADESKMIRKLCDALQIELTLFNAENFMPFDLRQDTIFTPDAPLVNLYWQTISSLYKKASDDGIDVLFNGHYGDHLYPGSQKLFIDIVKDGRLELFFPTLISIIKKQGFTGALNHSQALRGLIKYFLPFYPSKKTAYQAPEWLSRDAKAIQAKAKQKGAHETQEEYKIFASALTKSATNSGMGRYFNDLHSIERIEPYFDPHLINSMLSLPSYMVYRDRQTKYFVREAMRGLLPESIRTQPKVGSLSQFAYDGFAKNKESVRNRLFDDPEPWSVYVDINWMEQKLKKGAEVRGKDLLVIWQSLNIGPWQRAIKPGGDLYEGRLLKR